MPGTFDDITVDQCSDQIELTLYAGPNASMSILITPEQWATISDQAEQLRPLQELRRRRSIAAAREAASHHERGAA